MTMPAVPTGLLHPEIAYLGGDTMRRLTLVRPGMCGHNSLFVGQVGDWTWETVSALCGTNAFDARRADGTPTYLAFYYFHVLASRRLHPGQLVFGDRIEVLSRAFDLGTESVLTVHRIRRLADDDDLDDTPLAAAECYDQPRPDCIYVENVNRWIARSNTGNTDLVSATPRDFRNDRLGSLPARYSPRRTYGRARQWESFQDPESVDHQLLDDFGFDYPVDITRDINGVGLIYFAAYFSIVDEAILRAWRQLGRDEQRFLARMVLDHKLCFLGNADVTSVLRVRTSLRQRAGDPTHDIFDVVLRDRESSRLIAVSTVLVAVEG